MRSNAKKSKKPVSKRRGESRRRSRRPQPQPRVRRSGTGRTARYFLPAVVSVAIIACLAALTLLGYRTVTASDFFDVKTIDVTGVSRSSSDDIRRVIASQTERTGSWNADLAEIRQKVEKLPFVRYAAVSRKLPSGIKVVVTERVPIAIVKLAAGSFLIDSDGEMLAPPDEVDSGLVTVLGWDEGKTEKAMKENPQRIKMLQQMIADWGEFGLGRRVKQVDLADLQEPKAVVEDSGTRIPVTLARGSYAKSLKSALEAVAGKGEKVRSVNAAGVYPVIEYAGL